MFCQIRRIVLLEVTSAMLCTLCLAKVWMYALQVDVAPEFQQIVEAFSRNQVPQIHEEELLRLRDTEASDIVAAAKELVVGGAGFKVALEGCSLRLLHFKKFSGLTQLGFCPLHRS